MTTYPHEVARVMVAGVQFGDYQKMNLKVGDKLEVFGEPGNQYDTAAISLRHGAWRLGYIPKGETQALLWQLHRKGFKLKGYVVSVNPTNPTWDMFCVKVCSNIDPDDSPRRLVRF